MNQRQRELMRRRVAQLAAAQNSLAKRFASEVEFALGLIELLGAAKTKGWAKLIAEACSLVEKAVASGRLAALPKAVEKAEAALAPIGKVAKSYTVHCAGHAHIDMNWMWSWPETVACTNDTFETMLALMEEFPDFCFTQSQASVYAIARDYHPELLARIKQRVAEGRWEVAAVHWVEGDKNIAGGEALARHLLYTRQFMHEQLGLKPEDVSVDWEPDTFGHAWTIPTIVSRGGVKRYYMCRGGNWEKPPIFWYEGPDGSRVLVNLEQTWYNDHIGPHNVAAMLKFCKKTGLRDWLNVYGVGDHGGGPTRRDILRCHDMDNWPIYPNFALATTGAYYDILEANGDRWPVISQELNYEFTGCYTTQTAIKKNNRYGENYMLEAEVAASLAWAALGRDYPQATLRDNWTEVLFSHFHDILPGSGMPETRQYNQGMFQRIAAATSMIKTQSMRALAGAVDTSFAGKGDLPAVGSDQASMAIGGGAGRGAMYGGLTTAAHVVDGPRPFVVFNPTAWARNELVTATIWDAHTGGQGGELASKSWIVRTGDGEVIPAQPLRTGDYWGHKFVDLVFPVSVEALGYTACVVEEGSVEGFTPGIKSYDAVRREVSFAVANPTIENEYLLVEFDRATGGVCKLIDKATGKNLADPQRPLGILEYTLERHVGMSAWVITDMKEVVAPLPLEDFRPVRDYQAWGTLEARFGVHQASMEAKLKIKDSTAKVTYTLKAGQRWLEIAVELHWVERGSPEIGVPGLRMLFPLPLDNAKGRYEIPFGSVERTLNQGQEMPALRFVDITGTSGAAKNAPAGLAVLNDCKYGYSLTGDTLRATLIRSTYDPDPLPEIGDHTMKFAIVPHGKAPATAELVRLGAAFNHPLQVVSTNVHKGRLAAAGAGATSVQPSNAVVSSLRKAADEDALIFHLYETDGKPATAKVLLDKQLLGRPAVAVEVDFLERTADNGTAKATADGFTVSIPAHGIAAVKVTFRKE